MNDHRVANLTTEQLADKKARVLLIPLGSTEQHGPHLPLQTDSIIAAAWCDRLAAGKPDVLVAPTLPYGSAGEHQDFAGTLSIGAEALHQVLVQLARSAANDFKRVVFVSGHGGNASVLSAVVNQLRDEGHDVAGLVPVLPGGDAHAGQSETSIMLSIDPLSVRTDQVQPGNLRPLSEIIGQLRDDGMKTVTANGVLGDPTKASASEGESLMDFLALVSISDDGHC